MYQRRLSIVSVVSTSFLVLAATGAPAQTAPWSAPLRGTWVQTGPAAAGDVVLVGGGTAVQIVVGRDEQLNVRQAAVFLASDIEKLSGFHPAGIGFTGCIIR